MSEQISSNNGQPQTAGNTGQQIIKKKRGQTILPRGVMTPLHNRISKEIGLPRFMQLLQRVVSDPRAGEFLKYYRPRYKKITLDDLCRRLSIDPGIVYGWAAEGAYREMQDTRRIIQWDNANQVVRKNIEMALTDEGIEDRNLFFDSAEMKSSRGGTRIQISQSNVNSAVSASKSGTSLPDFDSERRKIAEIVRADE
jgi:hypothetical protein